MKKDIQSNYCSWSYEEIRKLFNFIGEGKRDGKKLLALFDEYAKNCGRKRNSVRNYYYAEIAHLKVDEKKRIALGINLTEHDVQTQEEFTHEQENRLILDIVKLFSLGYSVRKACMKLADGEISRMIRIQNKYRNVLAKSPIKIEQACEKLKQQGFVVVSPIKQKEKDRERSNIVFMPDKKQKVSSKDIESLFLGLVSLVKKCALEDAQTKLASEIDFANEALRKALVRITGKDMKIKELTSDNKKLSMENDRLHTKLNVLRCEIAQSSAKTVKPTEKMNTLKKFVKNFAGSTTQQEKSV